jgi:hypothetical protein
LQAQYTVSADNVFAPEGGVTGINYEKMFDGMKSQATKILEQRNDRDRETVQMWQDYVFNGVKILQVADAEDEEEDEFAAMDATLGGNNGTRL